MFESDIQAILSELNRVTEESKNIVWIFNKPQLKEFNETNRVLSMKRDEINKFISKLKENNMKLSVFGRVSAGKSTFINSLLGQKLLPSGNSAVTNTLIQIQKCKDGSQAYLVINGKEEKINEIKEINKKLKVFDEMKIYYSPNSTSSDLPDDLIIFDTPGIDFEENLDEKVIKKCDESDIIILILNCRSALGNREMKDLQKMKSQFRSFNIFIIFNFWDNIYDDDDAEESKLENSNRAKEFLVKELSISGELATDRVHFISAKKALHCIESGKKDGIWMDDYNEMKRQLMKELNCSRKERLPALRRTIIHICKSMLADTTKRNELIDSQFYKMLKFANKLKSKTSKDKKEATTREIRTEIKKAFSEFGNKCFEINYSYNNSIITWYSNIFGGLVRTIKNIFLKRVTISKDESDIVDCLFNNLNEKIMSHIGEEQVRNIISSCKETRTTYKKLAYGGLALTGLFGLLAPLVVPIGVGAATVIGLDLFIDASLNIFSQFLNIESFDQFVDSLMPKEDEITNLQDSMPIIEKTIMNLERSNNA